MSLIISASSGGTKGGGLKFLSKSDPVSMLSFRKKNYESNLAVLLHW